MCIGTFTSSPSVTSAQGQCVEHRHSYNCMYCIIYLYYSLLVLTSLLELVANYHQLISIKHYVDLVCYSGQQKTLIHTVHLLQRVQDVHTLPVADLLQKLVDMDGGQGQVS